MNNVFQEEDVHLMYSTPSCYLKALQESEDQDWPSKVGASEQLDSTAHYTVVHATIRVGTLTI